MVKDYTVLDGMTNNQRAVLKAAYDRGYEHGIVDGKDSMASASAKHAKEEYDRGFNDGWAGGSDAVMENVVKKILGKNKHIDVPSNKEVVTVDLIKDALEYIERLLNSGLGKKKSLEFLRKFIESEAKE